jgi:hypothetical protein
VSGHLFAAQTDLTRLSCDGLVLPCDSNGNISGYWNELLSDPVRSPEAASWVRVPGCRPGPDGTVTLLPHSGRALTVVDTVADGLDEAAIVGRVAQAVENTAKDLRPRFGRHLPLVALPLVGTGQGGQAHRRGRMVRLLVPELIDLATRLECDIALALHSRQDLAAVQSARSEAEARHGAWTELGSLLSTEADRLGRLAARGELSLFVGSGVSAPLGLPTWPELVAQLAEAAGLPGDIDRENLPAAAEPAKEQLGERYVDLMREKFDLSHHALGHALLAGLRIRQTVTTNYDPCLELAMDPLWGVDGYRVLTRHLAVGGSPWLLKLHGDVRRPRTMVLTASEYASLKANARALHGVVQSLMLTSHLLFVGFSLADTDFAELAHEVRLVRSEAEISPSDDPPLSGTALALRPGSISSDFAKEVATLSMSDERSAVPEAARRLEIFLDRLAFTAATAGPLAAEYLLDPRYEEDASASDRALRAGLLRLAESLDDAAHDSVGWPSVRRLLRSFGMPDV